MAVYKFKNNALYRYTPVDAESVKVELVITKEEFIMCYKKWICSEVKAESEVNNGND